MTELIQALSEYFARQADLDLAVLFGSCAAGRARARSDLDVAVLGNRALTPGRRLELIGELATISGRPVDLIDLSTAGIPITGAALTTGRTLFERVPGLRTTRLVRYLIDAADFMPLYERTLRERRRAWTGS
jgi:predicted nucleotidyltransferase